MAQIRNISGEARAVPLLGGRVVDVDEVVEVPDDLADPQRYVWPEDTWQVEGAKKSAKRKES